jgi:hypothetical protein
MKERRGEMEKSGRRYCIEGRGEIWEGGRGAERWRREEGEMRDETEGRGRLVMKEREGGYGR